MAELDKPNSLKYLYYKTKNQLFRASPNNLQTIDLKIPL